MGDKLLLSFHEKGFSYSLPYPPVKRHPGRRRIHPYKVHPGFTGGWKNTYGKKPGGKRRKGWFLRKGIPQSR